MSSLLNILNLKTFSTICSSSCQCWSKHNDYMIMVYNAYYWFCFMIPWFDVVWQASIGYDSQIVCRKICRSQSMHRKMTVAKSIYLVDQSVIFLTSKKKLLMYSYSHTLSVKSMLFCFWNHAFKLFNAHTLIMKYLAYLLIILHLIIQTTFHVINFYPLLNIEIYNHNLFQMHADVGTSAETMVLSCLQCRHWIQK